MDDKDFKLVIHRYLESELLAMSTEQALNTIFRYYGSMNLLTQEFYENSVEHGAIKKMNNNKFK